jgi:hypothetical protein
MKCKTAFFNASTPSRLVWLPLQPTSILTRRPPASRSLGIAQLCLGRQLLPTCTHVHYGMDE